MRTPEEKTKIIADEAAIKHSNFLQTEIGEIGDVPVVYRLSKENFEEPYRMGFLRGRPVIRGTSFLPVNRSNSSRSESGPEGRPNRVDFLTSRRSGGDSGMMSQSDQFPRPAGLRDRGARNGSSHSPQCAAALDHR